MKTIDIIPDIHGQADKLQTALIGLGWRQNGLSWTHPEPRREIVFLGDFIDRGSQNGAVIGIVRGLMDAGRARAVMGNHELNALHFHTTDPETGAPLRPHTQKNVEQHASFLREFPLGDRKTRDVLVWMQGLPLFIEDADFRAVHAAWIASAIDGLRVLAPTGVLGDDQVIQAGRKDDALCALVETVTKGPEHPLPDGYAFADKGGHPRREVRLQWWRSDAVTWRQAAMSVPDLDDLPNTPIPPDLGYGSYPAQDRPVFFGHYWLTGAPVLQAHNAICLDYSAGTTGPLVTYSFAEGSAGLDLDRVRVH